MAPSCPAFFSVSTSDRKQRIEGVYYALHDRVFAQARSTDYEYQPGGSADDGPWAWARVLLCSAAAAAVAAGVASERARKQRTWLCMCMRRAEDDMRCSSGEEAAASTTCSLVLAGLLALARGGIEKRRPASTLGPALAPCSALALFSNGRGVWCVRRS